MAVERRVWRVTCAEGSAFTYGSEDAAQDGAKRRDGLPCRPHWVEFSDDGQRTWAEVG